MSKSTFFTGQPILTQLLKLVDRASIRSKARKAGHDRYCKSFDTYTHLVTMLYCSFQNCTSSREVVSGMKACHHKLVHLGIQKPPARSTLCDANKRRSAEAFEQARPMLLGLAYRILGSRAEAEDVVQDTWIAWEKANHQQIVKPRAWLTTAISEVESMVRTCCCWLGVMPLA